MDSNPWADSLIGLHRAGVGDWPTVRANPTRRCRYASTLFAPVADKQMIVWRVPFDVEHPTATGRQNASTMGEPLDQRAVIVTKADRLRRRVPQRAPRRPRRRAGTAC